MTEQKPASFCKFCGDCTENKGCRQVHFDLGEELCPRWNFFKHPNNPSKDAQR